MTPEEMARAFLANITATRALMEDGQTGYVLVFADSMHLLCQRRGGPIRKDHPQHDDVAVFTSHARAVTAQRWWNHYNPDDKVAIALRREALVSYIDKQQQALDILMTIIEMDDANKGARS